MSFHKPQIQIQIIRTAKRQRTTLTSLEPQEHLEAGPPELVQMVKLPLIPELMPTIQTPGLTLKLQFPPLILLPQIQTLTFPKHLQHLKSL